MTRYPLYTTRSDWAGPLIGNYLYNERGDWIGWLDRNSHVFSVVGEYVGWLSRDFCVLRKRHVCEPVPRRPPPASPLLRVPAPSFAPLLPLMAELSYEVIDMFDEMPERLHPLEADLAVRYLD